MDHIHISIKTQVFKRQGNQFYKYWYIFPVNLVFGNFMSKFHHLLYQDIDSIGVRLFIVNLRFGGPFDPWVKPYSNVKFPTVSKYGTKNGGVYLKNKS